MFTACWEISDTDREDFGDCDTKNFSTLKEAQDWLGFKMKRWDYYCIIFDAEGHVADVGWMP